ncbi:hypothetical protein CN193_21870 [Sinorhizobium meliloti]|uniref:DUF6867 family protein n=1 Tax=Rhizobium meliloti TaxID=382 RepID=UPI000FD71772|nr:hypothetical protein [Sinorhizobium meliloti]RVI98997.1 hypothetical protein CN193_21870 [Sinorhizobium meliloti]
MQGILYEQASVWQFLLISCVLGGWTAWRTGKSVAQSWQGMPRLILYVALLGLGIRFVHHALFDSPMFGLRYYLADTVALLTFAAIAFRYHRTEQMTTHYHWLYEKASPVSWRSK